MDPDEAHDADDCIRMFNRCVEGLRSFRDRHLQMVATYIIIQARKRKEIGQYDGPPGSQSLRVQQVGCYLNAFFRKTPCPLLLNKPLTTPFHHNTVSHGPRHRRHRPNPLPQTK